MKLMNALTVRGKLTLAFACVLCLMTFLGGFAVLQLSRLYDHTDSILAVSLPGVRDSLRMVEVATRYRVREYRLLVSDAQELALTAERLNKAQADFDQARAAYAGSIADDTDRELYAQAMARWAAYVDQGANALPLMQAGKADDARELVAGKEAIKRFDDMLDSVTKLADYNNEHAKTDAALAKTIFEHSRIAVIVSVLLATALALGLGWLIGRAITLPLRQALVTAEAVAGGDLTQAPMSDGRDEVAQLMRALGLMVTKLRAVVLEVRGGVESVTTASTQIATGNLDLSQRTEEQASNLQQAAASMEELTSTVQQNAHNARAAAQFAAGATDVALRGGQVVGNVVATMGAIKQSSTRIADIIGVIDGIAFQTNILALNAAVEAARAGEQGRGFAVVAAEVRSLAQRSAQAAKEIKSLIEQSVEKVDNGSQYVDEAGKTMAEIVRQVQSMNDLVGEISTASVEQARGIEQVGQAVSQLDQVTQQNATLVEESAAAADSMRHQAVKLAETVALFKVGGDQHATPVSTASIVSKAEPAAALV